MKKEEAVIEAQLVHTLSWNIKEIEAELGIKWSDVGANSTEWWVRDQVLYVWTKDGTEHVVKKKAMTYTSSEPERLASYDAANQEVRVVWDGTLSNLVAAR